MRMHLRLRFGRLGALLLMMTLAWLVLVADTQAAPTKRADPPHAWWKAAEMALERGDCLAAVTLLEEKLDEGEYGAAIPLGDIHESGECAALGLPPAARFYERMIRRGYHIARPRLGRLYLGGDGVPQDVTRAQRLFKEAVLDDLPDPFDLRWKRMRASMGRHELPEELKAELRWADGIEVGLPRQPWWKRW